MIHVIGPKERKWAPKGRLIDTTSRSKTWSRGLSPFNLGPVKCYDGLIARNMENAWQFAKVYPQFVNNLGEPSKKYFVWRDEGWKDPVPYRYPMGKGVVPTYSWWKVNGVFRALGYVEARKQIYIPLYTEAVKKTPAFRVLRRLYQRHKELWLWDFDGYNHRDSRLQFNYRDVIDCETKKMGHAFVLAMLLEGFLV